MKNIDFFEIFMGLAICILVAMPALVEIVNNSKQNENQSKYIKELEQNQIEQAEEKEVYRNKCKMYEDMLIKAGLLDECECR